jgi:hypothetical protein
MHAGAISREPQDISGPTLADFWAGTAGFQLDIADTGLPMGESETLLAPNDRDLWSYVHASYPSLGVVDQCGDPVEFPGCMVIFASEDGGASFRPQTLTQDGSLNYAGTESPTGELICHIPCRACPCNSQRDHIDQQQYPRVKRYPLPAVETGAVGADTWLMVYEYRGNVFLRRAGDGLHWSAAEEVPLTGIWRDWLMPCPRDAAIGAHPHTPHQYDCLVGSPPGLYIDDADAGASFDALPEVYVFVGLGQNPGAMGCYRGPLHAPATHYRHCDHNPLFVGAADYGPLDDSGPAANPYFDFRTISSAEVIKIDAEYYMLYEGVRGPDAGAAGDTQFALGLARTTAGHIDGPWETYPGNPILVDMPGNVGLGHADLLVLDGVTYLYTSLDDEQRSRLVLVWQEQ